MRVNLTVQSRRALFCFYFQIAELEDEIATPLAAEPPVPSGPTAGGAAADATAVPPLQRQWAVGIVVGLLACAAYAW